MKKKLFFKGPPFEIFSELQKLYIFNAFSKYAVVLSSFEIQTSPICQIKWFYIPILKMDEESEICHRLHGLRHEQREAQHGGGGGGDDGANPHPNLGLKY